jgi:tetratricopeptide (TPR) repeat protein
MEQIYWLEKYLAEAEQLFYDSRSEEALVILNNLLYDEPGYGSLHNHLGWAYLYYTQDLSRAELHLKIAIRCNESYAPPYLHLGTLYSRLGKYTEAIQYLKAGLTKSGANRVALLQTLAYAYELIGQWRNAIKAYKDAMMASVVEHEVNGLMAGIKRCRRKRFVLFFSKARLSSL